MFSSPATNPWPALLLSPRSSPCFYNAPGFALRRTQSLWQNHGAGTPAVWFTLRLRTDQSISFPHHQLVFSSKVNKRNITSQGLGLTCSLEAIPGPWSTVVLLGTVSLDITSNRLHNLFLTSSFPPFCSMCLISKKQWLMFQGASVPAQSELWDLLLWLPKRLCENYHNRRNIFSAAGRRKVEDERKHSSARF